MRILRANIVGNKGIANPAATILSGAMMLAWLGCERAGRLVPHGVCELWRVMKLGRSLTTNTMSDHILQTMIKELMDSPIFSLSIVLTCFSVSLC